MVPVAERQPACIDIHQYLYLLLGEIRKQTWATRLASERERWTVGNKRLASGAAPSIRGGRTPVWCACQPPAAERPRPDHLATLYRGLDDRLDPAETGRCRARDQYRIGISVSRADLGWADNVGIAKAHRQLSKCGAIGVENIGLAN